MTKKDHLKAMVRRLSVRLGIAVVAVLMVSTCAHFAERVLRIECLVSYPHSYWIDPIRGWGWQGSGMREIAVADDRIVVAYSPTELWTYSEDGRSLYRGSTIDDGEILRMAGGPDRAFWSLVSSPGRFWGHVPIDVRRFDISERGVVSQSGAAVTIDRNYPSMNYLGYSYSPLQVST